MQACDRFAIRTLGIPAAVLMERAGEGIARSLERHRGPLAGKSVLIVCGKGNNGGDGFVAARYLREAGMLVTTALVGGRPRGEAALHEKILRTIARKFGGVSMRRIGGRAALASLGEHDVVIDALFGTGFAGGVKGVHADVIGWINRARGYKVAVDIPSGIDADDGSAGNAAVRADLTVTMGARKLGLVTG